MKFGGVNLVAGITAAGTVGFFGNPSVVFRFVIQIPRNEMFDFILDGPSSANQNTVFNALYLKFVVYAQLTGSDLSLSNLASAFGVGACSMPFFFCCQIFFFKKDRFRMLWM